MVGACAYDSIIGCPVSYCVTNLKTSCRSMQAPSEHSVTLEFKIHSTSTLNHLIIVLFRRI